MGSHPLGPGRVALRAGQVAVAVALAIAPLVALPGSALARPTVTDPAVGDVIGGAQLGRTGFIADTAAGVPPLPGTTSTSFVVADAETGAVLAAYNAHQRLAPASTLKTLTAITLLPKIPATAQTTAQGDAPRVDGTKAGIVAGTSYKADDLFTALLMMSANDAAVALSDANGGVASTLAEMNALAAHLQANDTVAMTPTGLDAPGQSSSAYDLALIFRAGLTVPEFRRYLALKAAAFPAPNGQSFQIQTHDRLLTDYPGMVGGKNGYTVAAQASYVGAANRGGHTIIVAIMRDQPNFWPEEKALLDWGFAADGIATPIGQLVGPAVPKPPSLSMPEAAQAASVGAAKPHGSHSAGSGISVSTIVMWTALGAGALFFLAACGQRVASRRRRIDTDDLYLTGLSGLSRLTVAEDVSELT